MRHDTAYFIAGVVLLCLVAIALGTYIGTGVGAN